MSRLRALLFDFGGTLDSDGEHWSTQLAASFTAASVPVERSRLDQAFLAADRAINLAPESASLALFDYGLAYVEHMLRNLGLPTASKARDIARIFEARARQRLAVSASLMGALRTQVRLAVVSNFTANLPLILHEVGLAPHLDAVVCSAIEGVRKPHPAMFRLALSRLGTEAHETAMIGDSLGNDIEPARRLGLVTVWLAGDRNFSGGSERSADHVVGSLTDAVTSLRARAELVR